MISRATFTLVFLLLEAANTAPGSKHDGEFINIFDMAGLPRAEGYYISIPQRFCTRLHAYRYKALITFSLTAGKWLGV